MQMHNHPSQHYLVQAHLVVKLSHCIKLWSICERNKLRTKIFIYSCVNSKIMSSAPLTDIESGSYPDKQKLYDLLTY